MLSKEEYISAVSSGNLQYVSPRIETQDEKNLTKEEIIVSRLRKIKAGTAYTYKSVDTKTGEEITVDKHSGDKFVANTIVNKYKNFIEIVHYKNEFECTLGRKEYLYNQQGEQILKERPRRFIMQDGSLLPTKAIDWDLVEKCNTKSFHRSLDNFYGYVYANRWKYFVTFTFSPRKVNRQNDEQVKYAFKKFRQVLQYVNKNVKMIVVPQRHKTGEIHFHGFVGNIDLTRYLSLLRNKNNNPKRSKCGEFLYCLSLFKFGFNSLAILPEDYNEQKIANYCIRYITRDERIGFGKKAYFRTTNLDFKDKVITYYTGSELEKLVTSLNTQVCKENNNVIVYRKYI